MRTMSPYKKIAARCPCDSKPDRVKPRVSTIVLFVFCLVANVTAVAQTGTSSADAAKSTQTTSSSNKTEPGQIRRRSKSGSTGSGSDQSNNFLELGNNYFEKSKWNAAEAAYNEATKLSPRNAEAWAALGYLYLQQRNLGKAWNVYHRLTAIDSGLAADLQREINNAQKQ
jgi:tetratricopeptide (TPR) repeat protein